MAVMLEAYVLGRPGPVEIRVEQGTSPWDDVVERWNGDAGFSPRWQVKHQAGSFAQASFDALVCGLARSPGFIGHLALPALGRH